MMLTELTHVPAAALPVAELKSQLRLGAGFADDDSQDAALEAHLRASLAAIEARTNKVLLSREFRWTVTAWRDPACQALPLAPVGQITQVSQIARDGTQTPVSLETIYLEQDMQRPHVCAVSGRLPAIPTGGAVAVQMAAGFAQDWAGIPADLGMAVMRLAAHYFDNRFGAKVETIPFPQTVSSLIAPYRTIRTFGGARR